MELTLTLVLKKVTSVGKEGEPPTLQIVLEGDASRAALNLGMHSGQPVRLQVETLQASLDEALATRQEGRG